MLINDLLCCFPVGAEYPEVCSGESLSRGFSPTPIQAPGEGNFRERLFPSVSLAFSAEFSGDSGLFPVDPESWES